MCTTPNLLAKLRVWRITGFDIVISAVGDALCMNQPKYMDAAFASGVKHFYPAECESWWPSTNAQNGMLTSRRWCRPRPGWHSGRALLRRQDCSSKTRGETCCRELGHWIYPHYDWDLLWFLHWDKHRWPQLRQAKRSVHRSSGEQIEQCGLR